MKAQLPADTLLDAYRRRGAYTDCYSVRARGAVALADFVEAFYTTWLFRLERAILSFAVNRPSTDEQAREVARGDADEFAAWSVEGRRQAELLMCDFQGRTRSWFMIRPATVSDPTAQTTLYFGSAVLRSKTNAAGEARMAGGFRLLLGFHKLYSRALLAAALRRLERRKPGNRFV